MTDLRLTITVKHTGPDPMPPLGWIMTAIREKCPRALFTEDYSIAYQRRLLDARMHAHETGQEPPLRLPEWDETVVYLDYRMDPVEVKP